MGVKFEWGKDKAASNLKKHGVSFEEGSTVFDDPLAYIFDDEDHSADECREIIVEHSNQNRLLLTCLVERAENIIRIFSARLATRKECKMYMD